MEIKTYDDIEMIKEHINLYTQHQDPQYLRVIDVHLDNIKHLLEPREDGLDKLIEWLENRINQHRYIVCRSNENKKILIELQEVLTEAKEINGGK